VTSKSPFLPLLTREGETILIYAILIFLLLPLHSYGTEQPITVTDFRGKRVSLQKPASRIVCLIESALSGLYMLGQQDKVVGIPKVVYDGEVYKYYATLDSRIRQKTLPSPGNWDFVSIESVVGLRPDLVIIWASQTEAIRSLEQRGIAVYGVFLTSIEDVYKEVLDFGKLTGSVEQARRLIEYTKAELIGLGKTLQSIAEHKRKGVYFMWAQGVLETSCEGSTVDDLIRLAGAKNVCTIPNTEHTVINMETLLRWNPDVIVMWVNDKRSPEDVINDTQLRSLKAVKTRQVYELPEVFLCDLWTLKFVYAIKLLAKWAYPEHFAHIDMEREKVRLLKRLYGRQL
jgi:iron complex transport system substrate-binding protein